MDKVKKLLAYIGALFFGSITIISVLIMCFLSIENLYTVSKTEIVMEVNEGLAMRDAQKILNYVKSNKIEIAKEYCATRNIDYIHSDSCNLLYGEPYNREVFWNCDKEKTVADVYSYDFVWDGYDVYSSSYALNGTMDDKSNMYYVQVGIPKTYPHFDEYALYNGFINMSYSLRYVIWILCLLSLLATIGCVILSVKMVGHKERGDEAQGSWETKIPFDLQTVIFTGVGGLYVAGIVYFIDTAMNNLVASIIWASIFVLMLESLCLFYLLSIVLRIKTKTFWKNNIIYKICYFIYKLIKKAYDFIGVIINNISVLWKTILILGIKFLLEFTIIVGCYGEREGDLLVLFILADTAVTAVLVLLTVLKLQKIKLAGEKLAAGDIDYKVDTSKMHGDIRQHGENLNNIAKSISVAVDDRLKSERMKTELITNVSHDIKTPLTSIINYSDLISKEDCDNEKIKEYSEVLSRQSSKLKRLIEDLVEASKASTGNLEVNMEACEANIFVDQAKGEYEEKLEAAGIKLISKTPEEPVMIMADSRRMWRIFDNLLNNICKYGMQGTRAYLNLEVAGEKAVISFKNTSEEELDLNPDELMERFVRGDQSRNTEGNGLGLSIAKSMAELQGGSLELSVDGDLFKAVLTFPLLNK